MYKLVWKSINNFSILASQLFTESCRRKKTDKPTRIVSFFPLGGVSVFGNKETLDIQEKGQRVDSNGSGHTYYLWMPILMASRISQQMLCLPVSVVVAWTYKINATQSFILSKRKTFEDQTC